MLFRFVRAGAFVPVAVLLVTLFGAEAGAWAQEQSPPTSTPAARSAGPTDAALPRFVSQAVVQPLPGAQTPEERAEPAASLHELVGDMAIPEPLSPEMTCLAQAIYFEARGEPLAGQLAVARVVVNRAASPRYPSDYCSVVTQRGQFSFVRNGRIPPVDDSSPAWRRAQAIARIAHQDLWDSEAGEALYFHATYVKPGWARRRTQLARIDTQVFYR